jgi:hypothetical protein
MCTAGPINMSNSVKISDAFTDGIEITPKNSQAVPLLIDYNSTILLPILGILIAVQRFIIWYAWRKHITSLSLVCERRRRRIRGLMHQHLIPAPELPFILFSHHPISSYKGSQTFQ